MQAMDAFLMPSLYEGLPLVLVEAQAAGLPCLISDSIPHDCDLEGSIIARLLLSASAEQWAEALADIFGRPERAGGAAIVKRAGFDARETASWLQTFYMGGE